MARLEQREFERQVSIERKQLAFDPVGQTLTNAQRTRLAVLFVKARQGMFPAVDDDRMGPRKPRRRGSRGGRRG